MAMVMVIYVIPEYPEAEDAARPTDIVVSGKPWQTTYIVCSNIPLGNTADYCGTGCQAGYGTCFASEVIAADPNMCGFKNDNQSCLSGLCCSAAG